MSKFLLEVCIASADDASIAQSGGADRLELNCALELGGLTPTLGLLTAVRAVTNLPIIAMIRPRRCGFCYSASEFKTMIHDASMLLDHGVDGLAFGVLHANGEIDVPRCRILRELCEDRQAVFHRAFDVVPEPTTALEQLVDLGFQRVMSSGQAETAQAGVHVLRTLCQQAAGRIVILPAGGINQGNVKFIVQQSGCTQVHASLRTNRQDASGAGRPDVRYSTAGINELTYQVTDLASVQGVVQQLRS